MWKKKPSRALTYQLMLIGGPKPRAGRGWEHVLQNSHHVLALILHPFTSICYWLLPERVTGTEEFFG